MCMYMNVYMCIQVRDLEEGRDTKAKVIDMKQTGGWHKVFVRVCVCVLWLIHTYGMTQLFSMMHSYNICIHAYIYTRMCICLYLYVHTYMYTHIHTYIYTDLHTELAVTYLHMRTFKLINIWIFQDTYNQSGGSIRVKIQDSL